MINHEKKFLFIHIPRTGGTSIRKLIGQSENEHMNLRDYLGKYNLDDYFKFAFVRSPYDKIASGIAVYMGTTNADAINDWLVTHIHKLKDHSITRTQYSYVFGGINFVGKFENLEEDWKKIADKIGISSKLPHLNKSGIGDVLDERSRHLIRDYFKIDFETFDYKP